MGDAQKAGERKRVCCTCGKPLVKHMVKKHPLQLLVQEQKAGSPKGIYSICSANEYVIKACMSRADGAESVLIEATANQVNQFGGYTGMTPADFKQFVLGIAEEIGFNESRIILGGDHLGPLTWSDEPAESAMKKAEALIEAFVAAGFTKIHIDTSMHLGDDNKNEKLDTAVIAERGARLCRVAEDTFYKVREKNPDAAAPVYVVGSEVPIPGGSQEEDEGLTVTSPEDMRATVRTFNEAFLNRDLAAAWERVIAVVVQPGVEFGDDSIHEYDSAAAAELVAALNDFPNMVFEGHSTDYQTKGALREMVRDGIAILKVGPALTFALREGLFSLALIEKAMFDGVAGVTMSDFIETMEDVMLQNPGNWKKHYHGDQARLKFARKYSFSDRCRYYIPDERVQRSVKLLMDNLKSKPIPLTVLSQYMPMAYTKVREGGLSNCPEALLMERVGNCADEYLYSCR